MKKEGNPSCRSAKEEKLGLIECILGYKKGQIKLIKVLIMIYSYERRSTFTILN